MLPDPVYQQPVSWFASLQDPTEEQSLSRFGLMPDGEPEPRVCRAAFSHGADVSCRRVLRRHSAAERGSPALPPAPSRL